VLLTVSLPFGTRADVSPGYVQPFAKHSMVAAANPWRRKQALK
jgi:hypothetical protein